MIQRIAIPTLKILDQCLERPELLYAAQLMEAWSFILPFPWKKVTHLSAWKKKIQYKNVVLHCLEIHVHIRYIWEANYSQHIFLECIHSFFGKVLISKIIFLK
jgi:hypothetical protein